jgi:cyclohexadieny/prephenate dehydrogenase
MILGVVGVGLLGGSLALAVKRKGVAARVVGTDRLPGIMHRAVERGLLDEALPSPAEVATVADLTVFCTPVDVIAEQALEAAPFGRGVMTDVGSTKAEIAARLADVPTFVPGHPLAGSEKAGPEHARGDLFDGRLVVLTPGARTSPQAVIAVTAFWRSLGSRVETMDAAEHDRALALTSHLPHLVASALAGVLPPAWSHLTASGFRDTTRLASGAVELWRAIFLHNRAAVREALGQLRGQLDRYDAALAAADAAALAALLEAAKGVRDGLG